MFIQKPEEAVLAWLEERRRYGQDRWDEVWDGVLHVVPSAAMPHQIFGRDLLLVLAPLTRSQGLEIAYEVGVFDRIGSDTNFRVPDLTIADPANITRRGIEARAELVVEILSPGDESRKKFGFYASCGIPELWIVHPVTRAIEVYVLRDGAYAEQAAAPDGTIEAPRLGLKLRVVEGPKLLVSWADGSATI